MANLPDSQHVYLDALYERVYELHDEGVFSADDMGWFFEEEPESVVFSAEYLDEAFAGDFEEARETVMAVGERDLDAKIRYWERIIKNA